MASEGQMIGLEELCEWLIKLNLKTEQVKAGKSGVFESRLEGARKLDVPVRNSTLMALNDNCEVYYIDKSELFSCVGFQFNRDLLKRKFDYLKNFRTGRV